MADKKIFGNKEDRLHFEKLDLDDLKSVAGGVSCGNIYIDDEDGFYEGIAEFKNDGWTYDELVEFIMGQMGDCTAEEKAFVMEYLNKAWNRL